MPPAFLIISLQSAPILHVVKWYVLPPYVPWYMHSRHPSHRHLNVPEQYPSLHYKYHGLPNLVAIQVKLVAHVTGMTPAWIIRCIA